MKRLICLVLIMLLNVLAFNAIYAQELIYTEDFAATLPAGWVFTTNGPNNWNPCYTSSNYPAYSGTHQMLYDGNYYNAADAWAFTNGFELIAGNTYFVEFFQRNYSSYYHESMKVTVGTAQSIASQTTTLLDLPDMNNGNFINRVSSNFTPLSSGTYYFGLNCYSAAHMYMLFIDLVRIYEIDNSVLANPQPFNASTGHPNIIDLEWGLNSSNDPVMLAYNTTDTFGTPVDGMVYDANTNSQIPGGGTVIYKGTDTAFQHNGLSPQSTYYYKAWSVNADNYSTGVRASATTPLIASLATDYSQGFDSPFLPEGWAYSNNNAHWDFVSSDASHGASAPQAGSHFARLDCFNLQVGNNPYRLISPPLDLRSGDKQLTFWSWIGANAINPQPIWVEISTDNQATWNTMYCIDSHSGAWEYNTVSLAAHDYAGSAYISFSGYSNWGTNFCNLGLDSFVFGHSGGILEIPEISISELDGTIWLDWEPVAGAESYRIEASADPLMGYTELGSTPNTEYSDSGSSKRFYRVIAIDE